MRLANVARKALDAAAREVGQAPEHRAARRLGSVATNGGPRVLFLTPRSWAIHVQWEACLGRALAARGARVSYLTCGGGRQICDRVHVHEGPPMPCRGCAGYVGRALDAHGHHAMPLRDDRDDPAWPELDELSLAELMQVERRGLPLGELVRVPVSWFLCNSDLERDPLAPLTHRRFLRSAAGIADELSAALERESPEIVIMLNGLFLFEQVARELCRHHGIEVVTYEKGYVKDTLFFSRGEQASRYDTSALWPRFRDVPLSETEQRELDDFLQARERGEHWSHGFKPEEAGLGAAAGFAVMFTNVTWDTAVQDRERCFSSPREWIAETVRWFSERPERDLVVRAHPLETHVEHGESREPVSRILEEEIGSLPGNVTFIGPDQEASSYALMRAAGVALVYTSTAGMEAAIAGTPCVTAATTQFSGKGFTLDPGGRDEYFTEVSRVFREPGVDAATVDLARRYAHFFFFKAAFPTGRWAWQPVPGLARVADDPSIYLPGGDRSLDAICSAILDGEPFLNPVAIPSRL